jgi:hypothetical protein
MVAPAPVEGARKGFDLGALFKNPRTGKGLTAGDLTGAASVIRDVTEHPGSAIREAVTNPTPEVSAVAQGALRLLKGIKR